MSVIPLIRSDESALNVVVCDGEIIIIAPGGVRFSMSAEGAALSAQRLMDAAAVAQGRVPGRTP